MGHCFTQLLLLFVAAAAPLLGFCLSSFHHSTSLLVDYFCLSSSHHSTSLLVDYFVGSQ